MDEDFLHDLFREFGTIDVKRMFSGRGIYAHGVIFAIVSRDGVLHFKTDETTRVAYERENSRPLSFTKKNGQRMVTSYWRLPERLYDDPEDLASWTRDAVRVSQASSTGKAAKRKKPVKRAAKAAAGTPKTATRNKTRKKSRPEAKAHKRGVKRR